MMEPKHQFATGRRVLAFQHSPCYFLLLALPFSLSYTPNACLLPPLLRITGVLVASTSRSFQPEFPPLLKHWRRASLRSQGDVFSRARADEEGRWFSGQPPTNSGGRRSSTLPKYREVGLAAQRSHYLSNS